jgi:hypothetical protein
MTPSEILKALSQGHERWPGMRLRLRHRNFQAQFASARKVGASGCGNREDSDGRISKAQPEAISEGSVAVILWRLPGGLA